MKMHYTSLRGPPARKAVYTRARIMTVEAEKTVPAGHHAPEALNRLPIIPAFSRAMADGPKQTGSAHGTGEKEAWGDRATLVGTRNGRAGRAGGSRSHNVALSPRGTHLGWHRRGKGPSWDP